MLTRRRLIGIGTALGATIFAGDVACARTRTGEEDIIRVRAAPRATTGTLTFLGNQYACSLGRSGILNPKYEGDGGTPAGVFPLREVRFRPDRVTAPRSRLPVYQAAATDGWCDDPEDPAYNRIVHMPYQSDAEVMWRDDHAYDVLAVIGYNDDPPHPSRGSAIFLHVAREENGSFRPTAGCVSMKVENLLAVLADCSPATMIDVGFG